jgi:hypothetical protein
MGEDGTLCLTRNVSLVDLITRFKAELLQQLKTVIRSNTNLTAELAVFELRVSDLHTHQFTKQGKPGMKRGHLFKDAAAWRKAKRGRCQGRGRQPQFLVCL